MRRAMEAAWRRGVEAAADVASGYNGSSNHMYLLEDCILIKLNQTKRKKPRKNPSADKEWLRGYGIALAALIRDHGMPTVAKDILRGDNIDLKRLLRCGLEEFDTDHLKKMEKS